MPNKLATALLNSELLFDENDIDQAITRIAADIRDDETFIAVLLVFAFIGIVSDLFLRWLRNRVSPWARP